MRVGWGFDVHPFGGERPLILGGVSIPGGHTVAATSDGDVVCHAVTDAVLAVAALGDMGLHFPSTDPLWENASSLAMLDRAVTLVRSEGWTPSFVDVTVVCETVRVGPHRDEIRSGLASTLGVGVGQVSVKATTTDRLGFLGRGEGIAAVAVCTAIPL